MAAVIAVCHCGADGPLCYIRMTHCYGGHRTKALWWCVLWSRQRWCLRALFTFMEVSLRRATSPSPSRVLSLVKTEIQRSWSTMIASSTSLVKPSFWRHVSGTHGLLWCVVLVHAASQGRPSGVQCTLPRMTPWWCSFLVPTKSYRSLADSFRHIKLKGTLTSRVLVELPFFGDYQHWSRHRLDARLCAKRDLCVMYVACVMASLRIGVVTCKPKGIILSAWLLFVMKMIHLSMMYFWKKIRKT